MSERQKADIRQARAWLWKFVDEGEAQGVTPARCGRLLSQLLAAEIADGGGGAQADLVQAAEHALD